MVYKVNSFSHITFIHVFVKVNEARSDKSCKTYSRLTNRMKASGIFLGVIS